MVCAVNSTINSVVNYVAKNVLKRFGLAVGAVGVLCGLASGNAVSEDTLSDGSWFFEYGLEAQQFDKPGYQDQAEFKLAASLQGEYSSEWNDGQDRFLALPFFRWDQEDKERTHFDVRELYWQHIEEVWDLKVGITRVFWGKTEFARLVDVINQADFVEDTDAEDKLGQPMVAGTRAYDEGTFEWYVLAGFRERTFPGDDGRLRLPLTVDTDNPKIETESELIQGLDYAIRWQQPVGDACEAALSYFTGLGREPTFAFNFNFLDPKLIPVYQPMDQTGLDGECIVGDWALKLRIEDRG